MDTPFDIVPEDDIDPQAGNRDEAIGVVLSILVLVLLVYGFAYVFLNLNLAGLA